MIKYLHCWVLKQWYEKPNWIYLLLPLSFIYRFFDQINRWQKTKKQKRYQGKAQLWIVGNITVGGNHKTPCVLALVTLLEKYGKKVAVIAHGYRASSADPVIEVSCAHQASEVGDEALLIKQQSQVPVVLAKKRANAIDYVRKKYPDVAIVLCDDGLHDATLQPDLTLALMADPKQPINTCLLPAGPFREPLSALFSYDWILVHQHNHWLSSPHRATMRFEPSKLLYQGKDYSPMHLKKKRVHAFAAIAKPERFFATLQSLGMEVVPHAFADHHLWKVEDFAGLEADACVVITEKDAVKIKHLGLSFWVLIMQFSLDKHLEAALIAKASE